MLIYTLILSDTKFWHIKTTKIGTEEHRGSVLRSASLRLCRKITGFAIKINSACCCLYCLLRSRCFEQYCQHHLNMEYDPGDISICLISDANIGSHQNATQCHVQFFFFCSYRTRNCIQLPHLVEKVFFELHVSRLYSSFMCCFFMSPFQHFLFPPFCILGELLHFIRLSILDRWEGSQKHNSYLI